MIDRLEGLHSLPEVPRRSTDKERAGRDFEQALKEAEEPDPRDAHAAQTDIERENVPGESPARRLLGERGEVEVEAVLLPWQLIPQATLSQLTRASPVVNQAVNADQDGAIAASATKGAGELSAGQTTPSAIWHHGAGASPVAQPWRAGNAEAMRRSGETDASRLSMSGLANPWSERLVRWISDPSQRVTAWVRDYGLEDADMPALIRDLLEHASGQSVQLARIVVNGQERWNAKQAHATEPR